MTIRASFASEETLGVSGNDRQHGIVEAISELAKELDGEYALNVFGVQGCGSYESERGASTILIVRIIQPDENGGMGVVGVCVVTTQGVLIESRDEQVAHLFYTAVEMYGLRSGDNSVVKHDNRPKKEEEEGK